MTQIIFFLFHALFFFTPLLLWPKMSEVFEFPKMLFVYGITILITTSWVLSWIKNKKITIARTPLDIPILLFLLIQVLATVFSIDHHTSLWGYYGRFHGGLMSTISYILLFYAFVTNVKGRTLDIVNTIILSTSLISVYAILEHFGIDKHYWVQDVQSRVFSTLGQPNWLSAYLVAILPLYLLSNSKLYKFLSILVITAIIFTKSQSGIAALAIVLLTILLVIARSFLTTVATPLKITVATLLLVIITITIYTIRLKPLTSLNKINPFYSTTQEIAQNDLETRGQSGSDSMAIRRVVWQGAINLGKKHPLFGTGPETFAYSYYWTRPVGHNLLSEWNFIYNKAHNEYLNFFATTGFLGLGSYLLLIIWTIVWWIKILRHLPVRLWRKLDSGSHSISTALFIGWLSILITNFFGFSVVPVALLFFLFPAIALALSRTDRCETLLTIPLKLPQIIPFILLLPSSVYLLISISNTFQADQYYNLGKSQSNLEFLESAVILQPNEPLYLAQLAELESKTAATIFLQLKDLPETAKAVQEQYQQQAVKHASKAVEMNKYNLNLLKSKARTEIYLSNINQQYLQQALNTLLQASLLAPTDANLLFNVGVIYQSLNQPDLALNSFKKALELKPNYQEAIIKL